MDAMPKKVAPRRRYVVDPSRIESPGPSVLIISGESPETKRRRLIPK